MAIKLIENLEKQNKLKILIKGINYTIANAIRRSVWEIPTIAIDTVEIAKNDSALFDEMIAHRLGLVVLQQDSSLIPREECKCKGKGCSKCVIKFKLEGKGPGIVRASQFKGSSIKAVYPETPIVWLEKDQEIAINIEATAGYGKNHVKYSPGIISYTAYPKIETKGTFDLQEAVKSCPKKALKIQDKKLILDEIKCDACGACTSKFKNNIKIELSKKDFIFDIESFGGFSPKEIFLGAIESLNKNLTELGKK